MKQDAADLGLQRQVHFFGNVGDDTKFGLMALSDIFVSASRHEGFGLVFLEAMAVGLPVISYDEGGQSEFLQDGLTGALVPSSRRERLFEKIRQLVDNRQLRQHISRHNIAYVENFFIERCAQQYEKKYRRLMKITPSGERSCRGPRPLEADSLKFITQQCLSAGKIPPA